MDCNTSKYYRLQRGLTQAMVGQLLGVKQATVAQWEIGKSNPTAKLLPKLAKLYKCKIDALLS